MIEILAINQTMKVAIILNGISTRKKIIYHKLLPRLHTLYAVEIFETRSSHDVVALASKAVDNGFDVILAAGGDGTLHHVINGVVAGREDSKNLPVLGVLPIGTGNDFARTLKITSRVDQILSLLQSFQPAYIDVGKIEFTTDDGLKEKRYFINVADVGMGAAVVKKVNSMGSSIGSSLSYYLAIVSTFFTYKPINVTVTTPSWNWNGKLRTLAIANGKYFGHGLCIAPNAKPDDNMFETFICGNASVWDFIRHSETMKKDKYIKHAHVFYKQANTLDLHSNLPCAIEADGELLGWLPAKIEMASIKIRFLIS